MDIWAWFKEDEISIIQTNKNAKLHKNAKKIEAIKYSF